MDAKFLISQLAPLPEEVVSQHNIVEIPSPLYVDEEEYADNDVPFSIDKMCEMLLKDVKQFGSAQSPPSDYIEVIKSIPRETPVFIICLSSKLSGYYKSALEAQEECSEHDVTVIDTTLTPPAMSLYAITAFRTAKQASSVEDLKEKVLAVKERLNQYWAFHSLKYLYKSGRINAAQAFLGKMIQLVPILTCDEEGNMINVAKVRRAPKAFEKISALIQDDMEKQEGTSVDILVLHTGMAAENGRLLKKKLEKDLPVGRSMLLKASYVTHRIVGPNAVSAAYAVNRDTEEQM